MQDTSYQGRLFLPNDPQIVAQLNWPARSEGDVVEWAWLAPDGTVFGRQWRLLPDGTDRAWLPVAGTNAAQKLGEWRVRVSGRRGAVAEETFLLVADKDRWRAANAEHPHERTQALGELCKRGDYAFLAERYGPDLSGQEHQQIFDCLTRRSAAAAPILAGMLSEPADELLLVLAYKVKLHLIERLLTNPGARQENLRALEEMLTRWDGLALSRLLESPDPSLRAAGAKLIGGSGSPEAAVFLEKALGDPSKEVRAAALAALAQLDAAQLRWLLHGWRAQGGDAAVAVQIEQALEGRHE